MLGLQDVKFNPHFYPVILAGGRGTRFWPLSRKRCAKQLLALDGKKSMIQQAVERLAPMAKPGNFWIITNDDLRPAIVRQLPKLPAKQILAEPVGRNTAPAIGLAAFLLLRQDPEAVLGLFPSDHVVAEPTKYRATLKAAIEIAFAANSIVVLGIRPTRPETGYGYIEAAFPKDEAADLQVALPLHVRRFTEKPDLATATKFLHADNYFWNSGMFVWRADTLANALREHLPNTAAILEKIAAAYGTNKFADTFRKLYPRCENISIDYAVLEPRSARGEGQSGIFCLPSDFGWNDLGSWTSLHEHHAAKAKPDNGSIVSSAGSFAMNAKNNYVHVPNKFVALVGVNNLVIVETDDALLVTTLDQSQDVGKVVKHLDDKRLKKLV
jgi:mannose-1-phosphate guanylyltransferase